MTGWTSSMRGSGKQVDADDTSASQHIHYEVSRLVDYAVSLCSRYPPQGDPGERGFADSPCDDALREAALIHLRLLDGFLGAGMKHKNDVRAERFINDWEGKGFLGPERNRIDRQVAHLDVGRESYVDWRIGALTVACLSQMNRFLNELKQIPGSRSDAFDTTRMRVTDGLTRLVDLAGNVES
jgi:hypothetical protein